MAEAKVKNTSVPAKAGTQGHKRSACNPGLLLS
ncbi:MAG: hypothetical protein JWM65_3239, partial [Sphingomonas bacterium]|nr:hypothetical protein [Sphingomonas bacterium]